MRRFGAIDVHTLPTATAQKSMRSALRSAAKWQCGEFIEQLDGAQTAFWQEFRQALIEVREEMHATF